ncbi:uncharacterized protein LOC144871333 [Branchiostoma floridae x Branchiostoma japonicum]
MLVDLSVLDFLLVMTFLYIIVIILNNVLQGQANPISQSIPLVSETTKEEIVTETTNLITNEGDGNIIVSTGSHSTVNITYLHEVPEEERPAGKQEHTHHKASHDSQSHRPQLKKRGALVPVDNVPTPIGKPQRQNKNCSYFIEYATEMSAEGKTEDCIIIIDELMKTMTDPDSQVSLRQASSLTAIYQGDFEKANTLLRGAKAFLSKATPVHEVQLSLWLSHLTALAQLRAGNLEGGIILAENALKIAASDTVPPGCITAYPHLNHAWFVTQIAAGQDIDEVRRDLLKRAEKEYQHAIEHAEREHPKHMLHSQSRVPLFAKIGLALLYLGCWVSVDNLKLGISTVSMDDIMKAKNVIDSLDKEETLCKCNSAKCRLMIAKTFLQYRLGSYPLAYDLAREAKAFATEHSLGRYAKFADSICMYLQDCRSRDQ